MAESDIEIVASFDAPARKSLAKVIREAFPEFKPIHRRTDFLPNPTVLEAITIGLASAIGRDVIVGLARLTASWAKERITAGKADAIDVTILGPDGKPLREWREGKLDP